MAQCLIRELSTNRFERFSSQEMFLCVCVIGGAGLNLTSPCFSDLMSIKIPNGKKKNPKSVNSLCTTLNLAGVKVHAKHSEQHSNEIHLFRKPDTLKSTLRLL